MFPKYTGPFLRPCGPVAEPLIELALGQWWLIADGSAERTPPAKTYNARWEDLPRRRSFRGPWDRGQRCIVPADCFYEPNWESGRHVPWCFRSADGAPWALAGLWNEWIDPANGESLLSFTLLTQNADRHPLMNRMHKPDRKLPADAQDKRSVVPLAADDVEAWLFGSPAQAAALVRPAPLEWFLASPESARPPAQASLL